MSFIILSNCAVIILLTLYFTRYWFAYRSEKEKINSEAKKEIHDLLIFLNNHNHSKKVISDVQCEFNINSPIQNVDFPKEDSIKNIKFTELGIEQVAFTIVDAFKYYSAINSDFISGVSHAAGKDFVNINSVSEYIKSIAENKSTFWMFKDLNNSYYEGLQNHYKGFIGEQFLARHLENAGHSVEFPLHGNNPGFDFIIDGHEWQVKTVSNFGEVLKHLDKYPDVPVFVNADCIGIPDDVTHVHINELSNLDFSHHPGEHVIAIDGFSNVDMAQNANDGIDGSLGTGDHLKVPYITLFLSSLREVKLLVQDRTDIETSIKNIVLDAIGTGGGAAIGAKTGAVIGTFIAPGIGTGIGTVLGGILGGIGGRVATNSYKAIDAENASEVERNVSENTSKIMKINLQEMKVKIENKKNESNDKWLSKKYETICISKTIFEQHLQFIELNQNKLKTFLIDKIKESSHKYDCINLFSVDGIKYMMSNIIFPSNLGKILAHRNNYLFNIKKIESKNLETVIESAIYTGITSNSLKSNISLMFKSNLDNEQKTELRIKLEHQKFYNYSIEMIKQLNFELELIRNLHIKIISDQLDLCLDAINKAIFEWDKLDQEKIVNIYQKRHKAFLKVKENLYNSQPKLQSRVAA